MSGKKIEIVPTRDGGSHSKITIAADRITIKISPIDPNREFLTKLGSMCSSINLTQTGRGVLDQVAIDRGSVILYTQDRRKNRHALGCLYFNEESVRFEPNK